MIATSDMDVDLPRAETRSVGEEVRLSITMGQTGELAINDKAVQRADFVDRLSAHIADAPSANILVVVRADTGTPYESVRSILEEVRAAGARRIAIATRQREKARS